MAFIHVDDLKELALRKIGRNVLNFQKIEGMLKQFVGASNFQSPVSKVSETLVQRKMSIENKTMGVLAKEYFKSFDRSVEDIHKYPEGRDEPWVSLSFKIDNEDSSLAQQKAAFSFLVSERNRLIHHMLMGFDAASDPSCRALIIELDKQDEMIQREHRNLYTLLKVFDEASAVLVSELTQEQAKKIKR
ncbi:hypothetical protein [Arenicella xantha]|uniref:Uncharacterized protein n=1 Tax=Arenicella xantha TaxID=644221 RepID=A0A395JTS9_9GAMM|nr:hypothetical protein [Arenicella xantha]RBP52998.1 hypothetical protein DFR28_101382 [Arenicella xantha]